MARPSLPEALRRLGAKRVEALLVAELIRSKKPITTQEILDRTKLRQPEVSVSMRLLRKRGWIRVETMPTQSKGRPMHCYALAVSRGVVAPFYYGNGARIVAEIAEAQKIILRV